MMSTPTVTPRESEYDGDSIYNCTVNGINNPPESKRTVITVQPNRSDDLGSRFLVPIISGSRALPILPLYGIQLLTDIEELAIHQTIDLNDLFSMVDAPNKFVVKSENTLIYAATECSSTCQRMFCCSSRRFILRLFDRTQQEALFFIRRLAPANPLYSCYLQRMDVFVPQCDYIGCVQQVWTPSSVTLIIRNYINENTYQVKGPLCCCTHFRDIEFEVVALDVSQTVSKIFHKWDESKASYILGILFLDRLDNKKKALILACAFLLEYIYFYKENSSGCITCSKL